MTSRTPRRSSAAGQGPTIRAIRAAVDADARVYAYTLWNDRLPSWAHESITGPPLRTLAQGAAIRRHAGVRIRLASVTIDIAAVEVDRSFTEATVAVTERRQATTYRHGHPLGSTVPGVSRVIMTLYRPRLSLPFRVTAVAPDTARTRAAGSLATV